MWVVNCDDAVSFTPYIVNWMRCKAMYCILQVSKQQKPNSQGKGKPVYGSRYRIVSEWVSECLKIECATTSLVRFTMLQWCISYMRCTFHFSYNHYVLSVVCCCCCGWYSQRQSVICKLQPLCIEGWIIIMEICISASASKMKGFCWADSIPNDDVTWWTSSL